VAKPSRAATVERRVAQVVAIIAPIVGGRDKVRKDQIEQAIRAFDLKSHLKSHPPPYWPPGPRNKSDRRIGKSLGLALGKVENQLSRRVASGVLEWAVYGS
jgi:hypothetical protein